MIKWLRSFFSTPAVEVYIEPPPDLVYGGMENATWNFFLDQPNMVSIVFEPEEWAPGLWVGMEGWRFRRNGVDFYIAVIDLENRTLYAQRAILI